MFNYRVDLSIGERNLSRVSQDHSRVENMRFTKIYRGFAYVLPRIAHIPAIALIPMIDFEYTLSVGSPSLYASEIAVNLSESRFFYSDCRIVSKFV